MGWDLKVTGLHSAITEPHANHLRAVYGSNILLCIHPLNNSSEEGVGPCGLTGHLLLRRMTVWTGRKDQA